MFFEITVQFGAQTCAVADRKSDLEYFLVPEEEEPRYNRLLIVRPHRNQEDVGE